MPQQLYAVGVLVGESIGVVGMGAAKQGDQPGQSRSGAGAYGAMASQAAWMRLTAAAPATNLAMREGLSSSAHGPIGRHEDTVMTAFRADV